MQRFLENVGDRFLYLLASTGRMSAFLMSSTVSVLTPPYRVFQTVRQIHFIGARSMFVIVFSGIFTGMVLALQGIHTLQQFGTSTLR